MKVFNAVFLFVLFSISIQAQSAKYEKAMKQGLEQLNTAQSIEDFQQAANHFERITSVEETQWLPAYYFAYSHMMMATLNMQEQQMSTCQAHLDQAQAILDKTMKIAPDESELFALQGFIYQGRIWEDPQSKGAQFSPLSHEVLDKAIQLDPENPRAYYLKGQVVFYTPEFWGGGAENALPLLEKALEKFNAAKAENGLSPVWGKGTNAYLLKSAQETIAAKKR